MREYFKPLRRKLGVVTLLMACLFAVGWVRSEIISEIVILPVNARTAIGIVSSHGRFSVETEAIQTPAQPLYTTSPVSKIRRAFAGKETQWASLMEFDKLYGAFVPYWLIVIPLIAISFSLLLFTPGKSSQKVANLWGVDLKSVRRKLGGATLMIACVFIGIWVRSQFHEDKLSTPVDNGMIYSFGIVLLRDGIGLSRFKLATIRGSQSVVEDTVLWVVPHWSIVLPLIALSACLLLSKPRQTDKVAA
ncbi:hypothetical protein [Schlesneria paludicola]|uniref:hypothetical protein n=1 Tax=Schlesneria paludicola TaxID=360056 RepID=UPI00029A42CF|nr:hypothetical protein [Schlesneria paludicola]